MSPAPKRPASKDLTEAADVLRGVLAEVDTGNLTADGGPHGNRLLRRLEGAAAALEVAAGRKGRRRAEDRPS